MNLLLRSDKIRVKGGKLPTFQYFLRKYQSSRGIPRYVNHLLFRYFARKNMIDMSPNTKIGYGLYIGHPYSITINPAVVIGNNVNIHKGILLGRENRGKRKGCPTIGDNVWIGINAAIVGKVYIGNDVLIAPNSYVNCDVPDHSIVFGNPCAIKHCDNATESYINNLYYADVYSKT